MSKEKKATNKEINKSGFHLTFGGEFQKDSIRIDDLSSPKITINFNGKSKKLSLKELAILLEI